MARVQDLARSGVFNSSYVQISTCDPPLCKACLHGKQHRHAVTPSTATGSIDAHHVQPGDCISSDQLESSTPGLVSHFFTGVNEFIQAKHRFKLLASTHHQSI
jgi:hypothetical protein